MGGKLLFGFLSVSFALALTGVVFAQPDFKASSVQNPKTGEDFRTVLVPARAVEVSPALFDLGTALDKDGHQVQGYLSIHYREGYSRNQNPLRSGGVSKCYSFLARDTRWKTVEGYLVDPTNLAGLDEAFVRSTVAEDITLWEDAADGTVDSGVSTDILGNETLGSTDGIDTLSPDGKNEVLFGNIDSSGAIAVTVVWGIFSGPLFQRRLVEWDQLYDQVDYAWSADASLEPTKMDFDNIAQHELGHALGLGHPSDSCSEETMYRFASFGETKKRSLESGDIMGVSKLY